MSQKSILITGCSSGIGYDAAHGLAKSGWRVFATCRQEKDCERLRSEGLESFLLDYEDEATISAAVEETLRRTGGTLDALFNNGAYAIPGAVEDIPRDGLRAIFEANLFGYHDLTRQIIPVMRAQGHGRIVNCSSILGLVAIRYRGAYVATKFAMEGLTDAMSIELKGSGVRAILIEPGPVTSKIRQNAVIQFEKWIDWKNSTHTHDYEATLRKRLYSKSGKDPFEVPASVVTKHLFHAITAKNPRPRYYVTTPTYVMGVLRRILPSRAMNWLLSKS